VRCDVNSGIGMRSTSAFRRRTCHHMKPVAMSRKNRLGKPIPLHHLALTVEEKSVIVIGQTLGDTMAIPVSRLEAGWRFFLTDPPLHR
jgi:hypothetical protein